MRINNNLMAMNTHRQLGMANAGGAKSMEKLSSGFRINRAGDDAAGLAISEKMRGQIRGLDQASSNAQNGISLIQTAEGALNETHAILQRMRELSVQSATDTNTDADRANIQDEINELTAEISRIAETTEFNTMSLLDGTYTDKKFHIGANEGQNITFDVDDMGAEALKLIGIEGNAGKTGGNFKGVTIIDPNGKAEEITFSKGDADNKVEISKIDDDGKGTIKVGDKTTAEELVNALKENGYRVEIDEDVYNKNEVISNAGEIGTSGADGVVELERLQEMEGAHYKEVTIGDDTNNITIKDSSMKLSEIEIVDNSTDELAVDYDKETGKLSIKLASTTTSKNTLTLIKAELDKQGFVGVEIKGTASTEVSDATKVGDIKEKGGKLVDKKANLDVSTQPAADKAITTVNSALETVSKQRSKLGAVQNRLEHTIKNLDTSAENLQSSESRIRDVDMAKEMMEQTKNNILQQASTAMLAQANMAPQSVLQLLG